MPHVDVIQLRSNAQYLFGMDGNVAGLALVTAGYLMYHDATVWEAVALACCTTAEQQGAHGSGLADADGGDGGANVGHGVVDGKTGCHNAAW